MTGFCGYAESKAYIIFRLVSIWKCLCKKQLWQNDIMMVISLAIDSITGKIAVMACTCEKQWVILLANKLPLGYYSLHVRDRTFLARNFVSGATTPEGCLRKSYVVNLSYYWASDRSITWESAKNALCVSNLPFPHIWVLICVYSFDLQHPCDTNDSTTERMKLSSGTVFVEQTLAAHA